MMLRTYSWLSNSSPVSTSHVVAVSFVLTAWVSINVPAFGDDVQGKIQVDILNQLRETEGFAGAFVGISNGYMLVMGGANFPNGKPWEGGTKVWYRSVYAARLEDLKPQQLSDKKQPDDGSPWKIIGELPGERGYGLAVTHRDRIICVGGSNSTAHLSDVTAVSMQNHQLHVETLPSLPVTLANFSGALDQDTIYVAGGQETASSVTASDRIWKLDLAEPKPTWIAVPSCPGPARILATSAAGQGSFWMMGGASLRKGPDGKPLRTYLRDVWRYSGTTGWKQMADLPMPLVGCPSPTLLLGDSPVIFGGDDGSQVGIDPQQHKGFRKSILRYIPGIGTANGSWSVIGQLPIGSVTTTAIPDSNAIWIPTGEIRPGIRTPLVLKVSVP